MQWPTRNAYRRSHPTGFEYKLTVENRDESALADALRHLPLIQEVKSLRFEVRDPSSSDGFPDGVMCIEPYGFCFCWYGGRGQEVLGILVAKMAGKFESVVVEEL